MQRQSYTCYRLQFRDGFHVAAEGYGEESVSPTIASDTLYSAICAAAYKLFGEEGVQPLLQPDRLRITSTFPFIRHNEETIEYFFPRPMGFMPLQKEAVPYSLLKRVKKVAYLSQSVFERVIHGEVPIPEESAISGMLWTEKGHALPAVYRVLIRPRVALDRITQASQIYHFAEVYYHHNAGLFFLATWTDENVARIFEASLSLLADEGIGADRSMGKGLFSIEKDHLELYLPEDTSTRVLLSRYSPRQEELTFWEADRSWYAIVSQKGWISLPGAMTLRRRRTRFLAEGSMLSFKEPIEPLGRLVEVLSPRDEPDLAYPIFRNGQAFSIPVSINLHME